MKNKKRNKKVNVTLKTLVSNQSASIKNLEDQVKDNKDSIEDLKNSISTHTTLMVEYQKDFSDKNTLARKRSNWIIFFVAVLFIGLITLIIFNIRNGITNNRPIEIKFSVTKDSVKIDSVAEDDVEVITNADHSNKEAPKLMWFQRVENDCYYVEYTQSDAVGMIAYAQVGDKITSMEPRSFQEHLNRKVFYLYKKTYKDVPEFEIYAIGSQGEKSEVTKIYNTSGFLSIEKPK